MAVNNPASRQPYFPGPTDVVRYKKVNLGNGDDDVFVVFISGPPTTKTWFNSVTNQTLELKFKNELPLAHCYFESVAEFLVEQLNRRDDGK